MNLQIFATVHSLMNYVDLIDSCQAHLPLQYAWNIDLIPQKRYWCCDWQRATPQSHMQNKPLFAPLAVRVQGGCSAFPFYTPNKQLLKYKTALFPKLKIFFIIKIFII